MNNGDLLHQTCLPWATYKLPEYLLRSDGIKVHVVECVYEQSFGVSRSAQIVEKGQYFIHHFGSEEAITTVLGTTKNVNLAANFIRKINYYVTRTQ